MDCSNGWACGGRWFGATVAIVGGGPSVDGMRPALDAARDSGCRTIAINDAYRIAPWADLLYFADRTWWDGRYGRAEDVRRTFGGQVATCSDADVDHHLVNTGIEGFDPRPGCVRTGQNSGYQAMHLALQMGARRIVLFGYDMSAAHGHHRGSRPEAVNAEMFHRLLQDGMLPLFRGLVPEIHRAGVEVLNASPGSALRLWPVIGRDEAVRMFQACACGD